MQFIEDFRMLSGKTVTLSAKVDGVVYSSTVILPSEIVTGGYGNVGIPNGSIYLYKYGTERFAFTFSLEANQTMNIEWAKLEISSTATAFTSRLYVEELALCQRYYEVVDKTSGSVNSIVGYGNTKYLTYNPLVKFNVSKRVPPTVKTFSSDHVENKLYNATKQTNQNTSVSSVTTDTFIYVMSDGQLAQYDEIVGYYIADAEIY